MEFIKEEKTAQTSWTHPTTENYPNPSASRLMLSEDDEMDEENTTRTARNPLTSLVLEGKYHNFKKRVAKGTLYRLNPMSDALRERVNEYVHGGYMNKDLRYAREIFGLINTSGRKDFSYVWESPWIEEHVRDTAKRKKIETHQKSIAVRNFLKASSNNDSDNVDKFINNVEKLTQWEDMYDSKEDVKTISRVVQSFERVAVRQLVNFCKSVQGQHYTRVSLLMNRFFRDSADPTIAANSLRRSCTCFDLFANLVACEINWADCTNGSRNLSIYANKLLESKKENALLKFIHTLDAQHAKDMEVDTIGIPLMDVNFNICISHGVLVVGPNSTRATYVLDIQDDGKGGVGEHIDLTAIQNIQVLQIFSDADASRIESMSAHKKSKTKNAKNHSLFSDL